MDSPNYERLTVWQDGMELVKIVYKITSRFPGNEIHGLTSQIRRAAVSIPANIAEGHGRSTKKDFRQFLYISKGSLQELNTLIQVARSMDYIKQAEFEDIKSRLLSLVKRLSALIRNLVPPA